MRQPLDSNVTRLLLVRHSETQWNREGRYQGQQDSPVTPEGLAQAEAVAGRLRSVHIDALYASDLGRCITTARAIERATGAPLQVDERLRERNHGLFEGLTKAEVKQRYPEAYAAYRGPQGSDYVLPGGESRRQVYQRAVAVMEDLAARRRGEQIAVVGHAGFFYVFFNYVMSVPIDVRNVFVIRNCSLSVLSVDGKRWRVESLGDVCHLGIFA
jgi:probable phosphoglycerate mutase